MPKCLARASIIKELRASSDKVSGDILTDVQSLDDELTSLKAELGHRLRKYIFIKAA